MLNQITKLDTPDLNQPLTAALLGKAIKAKRTQSNLRLEDVAALGGVVIQTVMKIEHGLPSKFASVLQICSALGLKLRIEPWSSKDAI